MHKNPDLMDIRQVCEYFDLSETTIRRHIRERKDGTGTFPLPLFKSRCRVLWKRIDIEAWSGDGTEIIMFTPSSVSAPSPAAHARQVAQVAKGLAAHKLKLPLQPVGEANG